MPKNTHDIIVVGAGHNGLTAASYMAKAGLDVLVLEKNEWIGGAAVSRELFPGWKYSNCSYVCSLLRPEIMRDLELYKYGLQIIPYEGSATMMRNGDYYAHYHDHDMTINSIRRHSHKDAEAYERYSRDVLRQCKIIKPLLKMTPPDLTSFKPKDLFGALEFAKHFAAKDELGGLGEKEIYDTIRFYTMSIRDYLDEYFESDITKAHLAGSAIIGTALGPCSPGSAYVLLHHYMGEVDGSVGSWGYSRGGMGSITKAMMGCLNEHGGEVKPSSEVTNVIVKNGRAIGVATTNGDEYYAKKIVSNLDAKRTFLKITEEKSLPGEFVERIKNFKIRGSSGKLNIALDGLPDFPSIPEGDPGGGGDMHFTETIEEMEGAYDDWKRGQWSRNPYVDMCIPSKSDPTMAAPGKHYMSVFIQYVPFNLANGGWNEERKQEFGRHIVDCISEFSPNFKDLINHYEVRTPMDLDSEVGLTEGNIFQGELTMDQLMFNRPVPGYSQYRTPLKNMYICSSSTHPGGGVMGAPGANAAREVLLDMKMPQKGNYY